MNQKYRDVVKRLKEGCPAAILTYLPKGAGQISKEAPDLINEQEAIPANMRAVIDGGIPSVIEEEDRTIFVEPFRPRERLIVLGGGHMPFRL